MRAKLSKGDGESLPKQGRSLEGRSKGIENFNTSRKFQSLAGLSLGVWAKLSNSTEERQRRNRAETEEARRRDRRKTEEGQRRDR